MAKEIFMPKFGNTQEESEILEWLKNEGDKVEKGDPIAVVSTDKISMEVEAPENGILSGIKHGIGEVVPVTEIIAYILQPGEELPTSNKGTHKITEDEKGLDKKSNFSKESSEEGKQILVEDQEKNGLLDKDQLKGKKNATPAARRIAKEMNIDLLSVKGSGPGGRIQAVDVTDESDLSLDKKISDVANDVLEEIPLIGMRRLIAENMTRSVREAPHMTLQMDIQIDAIESAREVANKGISEKKSRISLTAVIVRAVALAIRQNRIINSQFTPGKILVLKDINIGVAAAIEDGLIVPVIQKADELDVFEISTSLNDLAFRARENKLNPEDLVNGTFTISNLGMFGIDRFTAIINPPQSAILAVGAIRNQMVFDESIEPNFKKTKVITFTLSADHRVMDGAQAANFLAELKKSLQQPKEIFQ